MHLGYLLTLWKMKKISVKQTLFFIVMLVTSTYGVTTTINAIQGDIAFLNFTHSCNSTKVTLQRGGAHIYNSKSPIPLSSSNLKLRNGTDGETCFLYLTINPVTRDDQGGYSLFAYKNDPTLYEDDRIQLFVSYPPGTASCSSSEEHIDPDWIRLQCAVPIGNIRGFIGLICYQNGIKIPPLNLPQEHVNLPQKHDESLRQTFLAKSGDLVYCCSSAIGRTKDRCECKDSVWDPNQNKEVTNVANLCPPTALIPFPPFSQHPIKDVELESTSCTNSSTKAQTCSKNTSQKIISSKAMLVSIVIVCFLILVCIVSFSVAVYYFKRHRKNPADCRREQKSFIAESQV